MFIAMDKNQKRWKTPVHQNAQVCVSPNQVWYPPSWPHYTGYFKHCVAPTFVFLCGGVVLSCEPLVKQLYVFLFDTSQVSDSHLSHNYSQERGIDLQPDNSNYPSYFVFRYCPVDDHVDHQ